MAIKKKRIGADSEPIQKSTAMQNSGSGIFAEFSKHIMTGISYMIPVLIMGGLIGAFSQIIPYVILKISPDVGITDAMASGKFTGMNYSLLYLAYLMSSFGFTLFSFAIPIFAAFTANSIGGKAALISGFIGGYLANKPIETISIVKGSAEKVQRVPSGFLGALIIAFVMGYIVKWLNSHIKFGKNWMAFKTTFLVPLLSALITMILMIFVITPFGGFINELIKSGLQAAGFVALGFTTEKVLPITARTIAIVTPSFGLGLSAIIDKYVVGRRVYGKEFQEAGKTAIFLGFMGISEGSIPFALENPKFVIPLYVVGSVIGSLTGVSLGAVQWFPESAIWAWPLITNKISYIIGLIVGSLIIAIGNILYRNKQIKNGKLSIL